MSVGLLGARVHRLRADNHRGGYGRAALAAQRLIIDVGRLSVDQTSQLLSSREKVCLSWTARGKSSWEIGRILNISENTVNFHIKNALKKLDSNSRTLAAIKAIQLGIIEFPVEETSDDEVKELRMYASGGQRR